MIVYVGPEATPAQLAASVLFQYDPDARLGLASKRRPFWDFAPWHRLCAAAVVHDMMTLRALTAAERAQVDRNFERDCLIICAAMDSVIERLEYEAISKIFATVVYGYTALGMNESTLERQTPESKIDNEAQMDDAMKYLNYCAVLAKELPPYLMSAA